MLSRQRQYRIDVKMGFKMRGKPVQNPLDRCPIGNSARLRAKPRQIGRAKRVRGEKPVQITALHPPVRALRPFGHAIDKGEGAGAVGAVALADVDFIAPDRQTGGGMDGADTGKALAGLGALFGREE